MVEKKNKIKDDEAEEEDAEEEQKKTMKKMWKKSITNVKPSYERYTKLLTVIGITPQMCLVA